MKQLYILVAIIIILVVGAYAIKRSKVLKRFSHVPPVEIAVVI